MGHIIFLLKKFQNPYPVDYNKKPEPAFHLGLEITSDITGSNKKIHGPGTDVPTGSLWGFSTVVSTSTPVCLLPLHDALSLTLISCDAWLWSYHAGAPSACLLKRLPLCSFRLTVSLSMLPYWLQQLGSHHNHSAILKIDVTGNRGREPDIKGEWTLEWTHCVKLALANTARDSTLIIWKKRKYLPVVLTRDLGKC